MPICLRDCFPKRPRRLTLAVAALMLGACAARQPADPPLAPAPEPVVTAPYESAVLADLLVAEVAAQRDALDVSLGYYVETARSHNSPAVTGQAARLAAYMQDAPLALEMAERWLTQEPDNQTAHEIAAIAQIVMDNPTAAAAHIDQLLADDPQSGLIRLVTQAEGLDQQGNTQLLAALAQLTDRYPDQAPLWYARALHLQMEGDLANAFEANEKALKLNRSHEDAQLLKARLLFEMDDHDAALRQLRRMVRKAPDARRPRVLYIRLLLEDGREEDAISQLQTLSERFPEDQDLRFSLALYGLPRGAVDSARQTLNALLEEGYRPDQIHLYLAQADEMQGDEDAAIEHYLAVQEGDNALAAQLQAAQLYERQGNIPAMRALMVTLREHHPAQLPELYAAEAELLGRSDPEAAFTLMNEALHELPEHTDLLYARALLAERLDRLDQTEADLRRILTLRPDDPETLNALGYTLADRTDRFDEAYRYIRRALSLQPDNPAIIDSMGWVLYRMGQYQQALVHLQRAYDMFPDAEVAAHLGEVLWAMGRQEDARAIWQEADQQQPGNRHLRAVRERLEGGR